jgi:hypothetical protein
VITYQSWQREEILAAVIKNSMEKFFNAQISPFECVYITNLYASKSYIETRYAFETLHSGKLLFVSIHDNWVFINIK